MKIGAMQTTQANTYAFNYQQNSFLDTNSLKSNSIGKTNLSKDVFVHKVSFGAREPKEILDAIAALNKKHNVMEIIINGALPGQEYRLEYNRLFDELFLLAQPLKCIKDQNKLLEAQNKLLKAHEELLEQNKPLEAQKKLLEAQGMLSEEQKKPLNELNMLLEEQAYVLSRQWLRSYNEPKEIGQEFLNKYRFINDLLPSKYDNDNGRSPYDLMKEKEAREKDDLNRRFPYELIL